MSELIDVSVHRLDLVWLQTRFHPLDEQPALNVSGEIALHEHLTKLLKVFRCGSRLSLLEFLGV